MFRFKIDYSYLLTNYKDRHVYRQCVSYMMLLASAHQGTVWKGQERTPVVRARDCSLHSLTLPNATATGISSVALLTTMTRDSKQRQLFSLLISYQAVSITFRNWYISLIFYKHWHQNASSVLLCNHTFWHWLIWIIWCYVLYYI